MVLFALVLCLLFYFQLRAGSRANEQVETLLRLHMLAGISVAHARLEALNHRVADVAPDSPEMSRLHSARYLVHQAVALLQHEIHAMTIIAEQNPVRLLGIKASMEVANTVGTSFLTAMVLLLDRIYGLSIVRYVNMLAE